MGRWAAAAAATAVCGSRVDMAEEHAGNRQGISLGIKVPFTSAGCRQLLVVLDAIVLLGQFAETMLTISTVRRRGLVSRVGRGESSGQMDNDDVFGIINIFL